MEKVFAENPAPEESVQPLTEAATVHSQPVSSEAPNPVEATEAEPQCQPRPSAQRDRTGFVSLVEAYRHGHRSGLRKSRYVRISDSRYSPSDPDARLAP